METTQVPNPPYPPDYKRIKGKLFFLSRTCDSREKADDHADEKRGMGFHVRVIPYYGYSTVYIRHLPEIINPIIEEMEKIELVIDEYLKPNKKVTQRDMDIRDALIIGVRRMCERIKRFDHIPKSPTPQ